VWPKALKLYSGFTVTFGLVVSLAVPPAVNTDSAWGFAVWHSMERGSAFNVLNQPNPADLRTDSGEFMSVWTPGQYLIPGVFETLGIPLGTSVSIVVAMFSTLGLIFFFLVYRFLEFDDLTASICCALIASQRFFLQPFGTYTGGDILLFGAGPVILYIGLRVSPWPLVRGVLLFGGFLVGFFLKNSSMILALAVCVGLAWREWNLAGAPMGRRFLAGVLLCVAFLASFVLVNAIYNSRGWMPTKYERALPDDPVARLLFTVSAPFFSAFSLDDLLSYVLNHPTRDALGRSWQGETYIVLPLAAIAMVSYAYGLRSGTSTYRTVVPPLVFTYLVVFLVLNLSGSPATGHLQARHYRFAGMLLLPGYIQVFRGTSSRLVVIGCALLIVGSATYGWLSFANRARHLHKVAIVGYKRVSQPLLDHDTLEVLHGLDREAAQRNTIFYLTAPELFLEVNNGRALISHKHWVRDGTPADMLPIDVLAQARFVGKKEAIVVLLPDRFENAGKTEVILRSFVDVASWRRRRVGSWHFYTPADRSDARVEAAQP
jgi:hypothetical protein